MKRKSFKYLTIAVSIVLITGSCKKSFVELKPEGLFLTENYYQNENQAFAALVGVYDVMRKNSGGFENMITFMNAGSDDFFAGGGGASDGQGIQDFSSYSTNQQTMPLSYWSDHYQGIFRANTLLSKLPGATMDDAVRARFAAEAKTCRANYYFNLVRMFKNVPLILEPLSPNDIYNVTQATPAEVYAQIEADLTDAIAVLPGTVSAGSEGGRFTKPGAEALLGKVYLYEGKNTEAASVLADVNGSVPGQPNAYGNHLLTSFSDLWVFSNKFNAEALIEVTHSNQVSLGDWGLWGSSRDESNTVNQMVGPRSYVPVTANAPDFIGNGWSFNPITDDLFNALQGDPRFDATVFDVDALVANGDATYNAGACYQGTGHFLKKFLPHNADRAPAGSPELNYQQNSYVIRLADSYLMEAEALGGSGARAQALLDAVRARVGLPSVPVSLTAIKNERRLELAGEGHRFFDLVRWGDAPSVLGGRGFVAGKHEIFPIPVNELQGTKLVQNPNY